MILKIKLLKGPAIYIAGKAWYIPDSKAPAIFQELINLINQKTEEFNKDTQNPQEEKK